MDVKEQSAVEGDSMALTAKQRKLPKALQKAILKRGKKKKKGMKNGKKKKTYKKKKETRP